MHFRRQRYQRTALSLPENNKVSDGVRSHGVQHILVNFCLLVQALHHLPLQEVLVPEVTFSQHSVQDN